MPEAEVYRIWLRYIAASKGRYRVAAFTPSPYWVASEQRRWHVYAMALSYLPDSAPSEVLSIEPDSESRAEYRVVVRFTAGDENNALRSREVRLTLFAVRSGREWVLANALPRLTRAWRRDTVGLITYVIEPGYTYDRGRAEQAAAFVDSLASALGVPRPERITYFLTTSTDEVYHIIGLETDKKGLPPGGLAQPTNYQLFSGIPAVGEDYRHELTHLVILPLMTGCTTYFVSEGVPTWFGGTSGMDFPTAARGLAAFVLHHPEATLDTIMTGRYPTPATHQPEFYPAGGVFAKMAFDHGGTSALKRLFECGAKPGDFRSAMEQLFGRPWQAIAEEWRRQLLSFAPVDSEPRERP